MRYVCSESADRYSTISPRVCNPRNEALLPLAGGVFSALRSWLSCAWRGVPPLVVSEGRGDSRVACGVPIGTLTWSSLIRGSQGPSVTPVEWLRHSCLLRATCPLHCGRGWRGCGVSPLVVSEGRGDPRVACGVPISTLTWSSLIRGSQGPSVTLVEWLRHSCLLRAGCVPAGCVSLWRAGRQPAGVVWCGVGRRGFGVVRAVCVPTWRERAGRVACVACPCGLRLPLAGGVSYVECVCLQVVGAGGMRPCVVRGTERRSRSTGVTGGL